MFRPSKRITRDVESRVAGNDPSAGSENGQVRIALQFPHGRELLWVGKDSPLFRWEIGEPVTFRSGAWVVLGRSDHEDGGAVTFRLGVV
jgi:hypothetical protein